MLNFRRLYKSFTYAFRGLFKVFREEQNLRIQMLVGLAVVIISFFLSLSIIEWALIIISIATVLFMEVLNSAVERVADVLKPMISNYVKEIKDIMAAAVMLASLSAILVGLLVLGQKLAELVGRFVR